MLADIALAVGVNHVFGRHFPAWHGSFEFLPVRRPIHCQRTQIARSSWFGAHPVQGQSSLSVFPQYWAVAREHQVHLHVGPAANPEGFLPYLHWYPSLRSFVLRRIGRIQLFHIQILLIQAENGEAPGDVLIVPQRNPG